jgi:hypothetical protein
MSKNTGKYKCVKCGYNGKEFVFQFNDYGWCVASNTQDPEYIRESPQWVQDKVSGDVEIGEPVGCPKCHAWGVSNFEMIS